VTFQVDYCESILSRSWLKLSSCATMLLSRHVALVVSTNNGGVNMALTTYKAISRNLPGGLAVESESRGFKMTIDEPPSMGGTDTGMSPAEALLVSLGSCQCVVAAAFAKSQGIDLKEFWVEVEGDLDPAGFMKGDPNVRPGYQEIRFKMHIRTDAPRDKVEAFQRFIESRCPVGDSLGNGVSLKPATIVIERQ